MAGMKSITLKQLQLFVLIAQTNNLSQAAKKLSLSQSAASMSLSELEALLSHKLFDRIGRRLVLNAFGNRLLSKAIEVAERVEEIQALAKTSHEVAGPLQIGATLTVGNYLLPQSLAAFVEQYPAVELSMMVSNTEHVIQQVANLALDVGFIEGSCVDSHIEVLPWQQDELCVFARAEHPLAKKSVVTIDDLVKSSWILREHGSGTRELFDRSIGEHLSEKPHILMELGETEAIKRAVLASDSALGCLSLQTLQHEVDIGLFKVLPLEKLDLHRQCYIILHKARFQSMALKSLLDFLAS